METKEFQLPMTVGDITLAFVDGPDDIWVYALVRDYKGPQEYGDIELSLCREEADLPSFEKLERVMRALQPEVVADTWDIQWLDGNNWTSVYPDEHPFKDEATAKRVFKALKAKDDDKSEWRLRKTTALVSTVIVPVDEDQSSGETVTVATDNCPDCGGMPWRKGYMTCPTCGQKTNF